jgi:hypothetical protein
VAARVVVVVVAAVASVDLAAGGPRLCSDKPLNISVTKMRMPCFPSILRGFSRLTSPRATWVETGGAAV